MDRYKITIDKQNNTRAREQAEALIKFCESKKGSLACTNCIFHKAPVRGCAIGYPYMNWGLQNENI